MNDLTRLAEAIERVSVWEPDDLDDLAHIIDAVDAMLKADRIWWCQVGQKKMPGWEHRTVHCQVMKATDGSHLGCGPVVVIPVEEFT
jgi:hypothetical protein